MERLINNRNDSLDILKGVGIILMILGHCALPFNLKKLIFVFHMPLFFLVSGFLYKDRDISDIFKKSIKKVLKAYLFTGLIIWMVKAIQGNYDWGVSLILGNGSVPVLNKSELSCYSIGPLWYLLAYCWAIVLFHYLKKVNSDIIKLIIAFVAFEVSIVLSRIVGLLPLDLLPAIPAVLFLLVGYIYKSCRTYKSGSFRIEVKPIYIHSLGALIVILCCLFGEMSMASHVFRLNVFQLIAAIYITYVLYKLLSTEQIYRMLSRGGYLSLIGRYSLPIMCFHAVDWNIDISDKIVNLIGLNEYIQFIPSFLLKCVFAFTFTFIANNTPIINRIYSLKK